MSTLTPAASRFQSTLPVGGATGFLQSCLCQSWHFNPRSPWGERLDLFLCFGQHCTISIHAPRGGSDKGLCNLLRQVGDFNPRSPWGERPPPPEEERGMIEISIHAPRGGSDQTRTSKEPVEVISIHAPRGGSDGSHGSRFRRGDDFNPRSPWGERRLPTDDAKL